ncbi:MAG: aldehyde:ferredoxin oxidoreductase [Candidatus Thermoplasmatota archaeon]|nr:aldehyde:ferredoxin oxidoreductase [Candidatus Thermoplasmatota archaeon]
MSAGKDRTIKEFDFDPNKVEKGYTGESLKIDLEELDFEKKKVTEQMKELFIGGRGFDLWLLWNGVNDDTEWDDPENEICISSGPLGGDSVYPGSGNSVVTSISPLTGAVIDSNVGGYFGPYLLFAGFDALEIQGKAEEEVIIYVDGIEEKIRFDRPPEDLPEDSYGLSRELTDIYSQENPRQISVVSSGPGAENVNFGLLNFSWYDMGRDEVRYKQAGRGGTGTVFKDKNIVALVVRSEGEKKGINPDDPERLKEVRNKHAKEINELDSKQHHMSKVGTAHLVPIMNDFDLLPTHNFRYGSHEDGDQIGEEVYEEKFDEGYDGCVKGCTVQCAHCVTDFEISTGPYAGERVLVDGPEYETIAGTGSNCGIFDPDHVLEMNFYCDAYGLDTISVGTATAFAMECAEMGLIPKDVMDDVTLKFGNKDAALKILHQMAEGEGFGSIVGKGVKKMKDIFEERYDADRETMEDIGMECKGLEYSEYVTKESLAQQGGYGLALKGPQHDEAWLIFLDMVQNLMPTFEDKAEALHWFPMWRTWFGLNGLCKLPWNDITPEDNEETEEPAKVMKHVLWYSQFFSSVTGREKEPEDLIRDSERIYNFQRIFNLRLGYGTREYDEIPFRSAGPVTETEYESREERYDDQLKKEIGVDPEGKSTEEKLKILRDHREEQYEKLMDAVYKRRGWTENGVPTKEKLEELDLDRIPEVIEKLEER